MSLKAASTKLPRHIKPTTLTLTSLSPLSLFNARRDIHTTHPLASQFGSPNPSATNPGASPMNQQPKGQSAESASSTSTSPAARQGAADQQQQQQQQKGHGDGTGQSSDAVNSLGGHREGRTHEEKAPNQAINVSGGTARMLAVGAVGLGGAYYVFGRGDGGEGKGKTV